MCTNVSIHKINNIESHGFENNYINEAFLMLLNFQHAVLTNSDATMASASMHPINATVTQTASMDLTSSTAVSLYYIAVKCHEVVEYLQVYQVIILNP